ncbi:MAG: alpha-mannosidase [Candidatus Eremiobacterota bacterium]
MHHRQRWTVEKLARRLRLVETMVYRRRHGLPAFRLKRADSPGGWEEIPPDTGWGDWRMDFLLSSTLQVPGDWEGPLSVYLPLGEAGDFSHPEALLYLDGSPYAGCDRHHQEVALPGTLQDGREHRLELHGWTGLGGSHRGDPGRRLVMRSCFLVQPDLPTREFLAAARVVHGIAAHLPEDEPSRGWMLNVLDESFRLLDTREPLGETFYASVPQALQCLRLGLRRCGAPLPVHLTATGHAHLDVAWLWTLGQTRRKGARTFSTVLRLMEQFPEYHFTQSQPQLYDYLLQDHPELFEEIRQRVAQKRWEPTGGMWVEADANLTGAESLARQLLLGRSFFRRHFGPQAESPVLFLPDVFGYSAALPQLIRQAGLRYFFTIKIGWSQYNRMPYDSFWWQGLDGTRVLTHFSTSPDLSGTHASTYNSFAVPEQVLGCWTAFQQKEVQDAVLMLYGWGDGGGGPTREMLENLREMHSLPATPQVRQGSVGSFFERLEAESGRVLPTWNGELYLELHRGTYTSQSRSKRANRKSEFRLHDAEFLATWAWLQDAPGEYPRADLERAWQLVCLNQFHDILPGSSIGEVYRESMEQYREVQELGERVVQASVERLGGLWGGDVLVVNPTSFTSCEPVFLAGDPPAGLQTADGFGIPMQRTSEGAWLALECLPYSVTALQASSRPASFSGIGVRAGERFLENLFVRVELDERGDVVRMLDKVRLRDVLAGSTALVAFEDRPLEWDAWDVDIFFDDKSWPAEPADSVRVLESGPLRGVVEVRRNILNSRVVQRLVLNYHSSRLDFETEVEWRERHILLKAAFPVNVLAREATFEVQWGQVTRPTHRNTSWDWARFETCAHKWADLSESDYGVSLLNDCKYGHDVRDNVMRLSLLRGPTEPDPEADLGLHRFTFSLFPHHGPVGPLTVSEAYRLNDPLRAFRLDGGACRRPAMPLVMAVDNPNVVLETVKRSEDGSAVVVRLYESQRSRGALRLETSFPLKAAFRVNLLEEDPEPLPVEDNQVLLSVRPFEIVTLKLTQA